MFRCVRPIQSVGRFSASIQTRNAIFYPPPVSFDETKFGSVIPLMSEKSFDMHYHEIYLPLYKQLNNVLSKSHYKDSSLELPQILRKTLSNQGEKELFTIVANVRNHELFFGNLAPRHQTTYEEAMEEDSKKAITDNFTSLDNLKYEFSCQAAALPGSGWVYLIDREGTLSVVASHNSYTPEAVDESITPIICLDVWEHAYWNDFGMKREEYAENFWHVVDWEVVNKRLKEAAKKYPRRNA